MKWTVGMLRNKRKSRKARKRRFYSIHDNGDGTVDVYLSPDGRKCRANRDFFLVVRGIVPYDRLEADIRNRYNDWCESAEIILL